MHFGGKHADPGPGSSGPTTGADDKIRGGKDGTLVGGGRGARYQTGRKQRSCANRRYHRNKAKEEGERFEDIPKKVMPQKNASGACRNNIPYQRKGASSSPMKDVGGFGKKRRGNARRIAWDEWECYRRGGRLERGIEKKREETPKKEKKGLNKACPRSQGEWKRIKKRDWRKNGTAPKETTAEFEGKEKRC